MNSRNDLITLGAAKAAISRALVAVASWLLLLGTLASNAIAGPTLTISDLGLNGSMNREWLVEVAPDPALFTNTNNGLGGSLAFELAFEVTGSDLVGVSKNAVDWPFDIPGNNPFTGSVTTGIQTDVAADTVFASLLSEFLTTGDHVNALTIETMGSAATTLSWGGHVVLPGTQFEYIGSRISQAGFNFDGFMGSLSSGGGGVTCDFNNSGACDIDDIDALVAEVVAGTNDPAFDLTGDGVVNREDIRDPDDGWLRLAGEENIGPGKSYLEGDITLDGVVDGLDFIDWNTNKFMASGLWSLADLDANGVTDGLDFIIWNTFKFMSSDSQVVPEPSTWSLLALVGVAVTMFTRRR
jgi:hypothetical protein